MSRLIDRQDDIDNEDIDLREYFYLLRRHVWEIFGTTAVVSALALLVIFSLRPVYLSQATLLIESNDANIISIEDVYRLGTGNRSEYYATQFEILKSRRLAEEVVRRHPTIFDELLEDRMNSHLRRAIEFVSATKQMTEEEFFEKKIMLFQEALIIKPVRGTQLVTIGFESEQPETTTILANELAQVYIEDNLEVRLVMRQQATTWLASRIEGLKNKLKDSEEKLQRYREAEGLVDMEGAKTLAIKELEENSTRLSEARKQRVQAENIASQTRKLSNRNSISLNDVEALSAIPAVLQHGLVQRFKEQEGAAEQKLSELSKRYGPMHPKIIAAKSDLDAAKQNTASQVFKVVEGVHKEYELAKATEDSLSEEVARLKNLVQETNRKQYQLDELAREVSINRQLYDTFFNRVKETAEAGDLQTANARIVDPAALPLKPAKPKFFLLSILAVVSGLLTSISLVFLRNSFDNTIKSRDDVVIKLHTQLLGVLPILREKKLLESSALIYNKMSNCSFSESIRTIRTGVVLSGLDNPHKILVVTSSIPGEGKSTTACNLALAFGQIGKTLLIDADLRRPTIAKNFGIKLSSPGLSNLVAETALSKECIYRIEGMEIDVIPAGMVPPNPLELLSSKRFASVLASLEKQYDRIIIDTAPCEAVSDALILSTLSSAMIYVVKADSTTIRAAKSGIGRLKEVNAPITGVVLNQVNPSKDSAYGNGRYYGGYYDYYGYSASSRSEKI